jgi:hypothetical protein
VLAERATTLTVAGSVDDAVDIAYVVRTRVPSAFDGLWLATLPAAGAPCEDPAVSQRARSRSRPRRRSGPVRGHARLRTIRSRSRPTRTSAATGWPAHDDVAADRGALCFTGADARKTIEVPELAAAGPRWTTARAASSASQRRRDAGRARLAPATSPSRTIWTSGFVPRPARSPLVFDAVSLQRLAGARWRASC